MPTLRRIFRFSVVVVVLVVLGLLGVRWLESEVRKRSERIVAQAAGPGSRIRIDEVGLDLLKGDIRWTGVNIEQSGADQRDIHQDRSSWFSGRVDMVEVRGLSYWQLIFRGKLSMRSLNIFSPDIELEANNDTTASSDPTSGAMEISSFSADSVVVHAGVFHMRHYAADTMILAIDTVELSAMDIRANWGKIRQFDLRLASSTGELRGIHATLSPLYDLQAVEVELFNGGRTLRLTNVDLKPLKGPQEYHQVVSFESDLFDVHLDTAMVEGLDLTAMVNARTFASTAMRIVGADLNIYRDKTMPDGPFRSKPLPARMLRELPFLVCMEHLEVDSSNVYYHEKDTNSPDFGEVSFTNIHGVVEGLCTIDTLSMDTMVLLASADGLGEAHITLQLRTVIADRSDRFTANGMISAMSFNAFNTMTGDLILARATAGTIGGMDLTMTADEDRATGRVDMEYDGLSLELLKQDGSGGRRKFLSSLMNQVVRSRNLRSAPDFRHGDFDFERRKDRSVFNYLWSGLREGMIITALPGALEDLRQFEKDSRKD